jgi:hypothetical protein
MRTEHVCTARLPVCLCADGLLDENDMGVRVEDLVSERANILIVRILMPFEVNEVLHGQRRVGDGVGAVRADPFDDIQHVKDVTLLRGNGLVEWRQSQCAVVERQTTEWRAGSVFLTTEIARPFRRCHKQTIRVVLRHFGTHVNTHPTPSLHRDSREGRTNRSAQRHEEGIGMEANTVQLTAGLRHTLCPEKHTERHARANE